MTFGDLKTILKHGARVAEGVLAATGVQRDLDLLKKTALNLAVASDFPLAAGVRAWSRSGFPERINAALEDDEIRAWLLAWASAPRALKAGAGKAKR